MVDAPEKQSPLRDLAMPRQIGTEANVELTERLCDSLVQVQAWPNSVGKVEKILKTLKRCVTMPSGPGRWLIEGEEEGLEEGLRRELTDDLGAVTGLTHARVVISISGPRATRVLASGIALDFDESNFAVGSTQLAHHHEIGLTIHRLAEDQFDLYVFTSLSRSFWQWIEKASAEYGCRIV